MKEKKCLRSSSYYSHRSVLRFILGSGLISLIILSNFTLSYAQWFAPHLLYPFSFINSGSQAINLNIGRLWPLSYSQIFSFPCSYFPYHSLSLPYKAGWLWPVATSLYSQGGMSSLAPFFTPTNSSYLYYSLNNNQAIYPNTSLPFSRIAASSILKTGAPAGIESGQIQYKPPAVHGTGLTFVPGIPAYAPNQVIVQFLPMTSPVEVNRICANHQCKELYTSPYAGYTILGIPTYLTVIQAAQKLSTEASILFAEPNYYRQAHFIPNDPYYTFQWHLKHLNCNLAWDYVAGGGALVALLDSGVAYETNGIFTKAPDLTGTLFAPGYDFINDDAFPNDDYGHGTHMAGCIAQTTNNLLGVAGVAFGATIMPVKIMDSIGGVTIADEVNGIYFAANNGADIINMSLGGPGTSTTESAAITYAYNAGTTIICSAGNSASGTPEYPASYPEPVSVTSIRYDYTFASTYSNYGIYVDVCAPGGDLNSDLNSDGFGDGILQQTHDGKTYSVFSYYFLEGTSPAAALVSGVAALIISKSSIPIAPPDVVAILKGSTTDLGTTGWDQYYGTGLVDAYRAVLQTP